MAKSGTGGYSRRRRNGNQTFTTNSKRGTTYSSSIKTGPNSRITTTHLPNGTTKQTRTTTIPGFGTKREVKSMSLPRPKVTKPKFVKVKSYRPRRGRPKKLKLTSSDIFVIIVILAVFVILGAFH